MVLPLVPLINGVPLGQGEYSHDSVLGQVTRLTEVVPVYLSFKFEADKSLCLRNGRFI